MIDRRINTKWLNNDAYIVDEQHYIATNTLKIENFHEGIQIYKRAIPRMHPFWNDDNNYWWNVEAIIIVYVETTPNKKIMNQYALVIK